MTRSGFHDWVPSIAHRMASHRPGHFSTRRIIATNRHSASGRGGFAPTLDLKRHKICRRIPARVLSHCRHPFAQRFTPPAACLVALLRVVCRVGRRAERPTREGIRDVVRDGVRRDRRDVPPDRLAVATDQELDEVPVQRAREAARQEVVHAVVGHAAPRGGGQAVLRVRVVAARETAVAGAVRAARGAEHRVVVDRHFGHEGVRLWRRRGHAAVRVDLEVGGRLLQPELVAREGDDAEPIARELLK
jgi:hypothetical protein